MGPPNPQLDPPIGSRDPQLGLLGPNLGLLGPVLGLLGSKRGSQDLKKRFFAMPPLGKRENAIFPAWITIVKSTFWPWGPFLDPVWGVPGPFWGPFGPFWGVHNAIGGNFNRFARQSKGKRGYFSTHKPYKAMTHRGLWGQQRRKSGDIALRAPVYQADSGVCGAHRAFFGPRGKHHIRPFHIFWAFPWPAGPVLGVIFIGSWRFSSDRGGFIGLWLFSSDCGSP